MKHDQNTQLHFTWKIMTLALSELRAKLQRQLEMRAIARVPQQHDESSDA